jgi:hypothetical protein
MEGRKSIKNSEYVTAKGRFTLRSFINSYIKFAVSVASQNLIVREYDEKVRKNILDNFGYRGGQGVFSQFEVGQISCVEIGESDMKKIEKPLYWNLVGDENGHPLKYVQGKEPGESARMYLKRKLSDEEINELTDKFLEGKVGEQVDIRIRKALVDRVNVDIL